MLFRIDHERFITHAIDHFTREEILSMGFLIVSAGVQDPRNQKWLSGLTLNGESTGNVLKINELYPNDEVQDLYIRFGSKDKIRDMYMDQLKGYDYLFYNALVSPILSYQNRTFICKMRENDYIDIILEYVKKTFSIDHIDLNELFSKGRVGPYYIDREDIHNSTVKIARRVFKDKRNEQNMTEGGRLLSLGEMSKKEKLKLLKKLGIKVNDNEHDLIDDLLMESWVSD